MFGVESKIHRKKRHLRAFCDFFEVSLLQPRLALNWLCTQAWPWTSDSPASTSWVLGWRLALQPALRSFTEQAQRWIVKGICQVHQGHLIPVYLVLYKGFYQGRKDGKLLNSLKTTTRLPPPNLSHLEPGWRDAAGVKSTLCSCRGPAFRSQHLYWSAHIT